MERNRFSENLFGGAVATDAVGDTFKVLSVDDSVLSVDTILCLAGVFRGANSRCYWGEGRTARGVEMDRLETLKG